MAPHSVALQLVEGEEKRWGEYTLPVKGKTQKLHISPQPYPELSLTATLRRKGHWESSLNFGWPYAQLQSQSSWKERRPDTGESWQPLSRGYILGGSFLSSASLLRSGARCEAI